MTHSLAEVIDVFFNKRPAAQEGRTEAEVRSETLKDLVLRAPCRIRVGKKYFRVTVKEEK